MRRMDLGNIHRPRTDVFDPEFARHLTVIKGRYYYPYDEDDDEVFWPSPWITAYDDQT